MRMLHYLAAIAHRRVHLPAALARYDEGVAVARRIGRVWAPFGMECRLVGALTAYELATGSRRAATGHSQETVPQPNRSLYEAAALSVAAGRGHPVEPGVIRGLREWWPVDGLSVVLTVHPGIDLLGDAGDVEGALDLTDAGIAVLERTWGKFQAITRMAALLAGQAAGAIGSPERPRPSRPSCGLGSRTGSPTSSSAPGRTSSGCSP